MTSLNRQINRKCIKPLDGSFGIDGDKYLAVRLVPGTDTVPDVIELWPLRSQRVERVALVDVFRFAIRSRVGRENLEKARARKEKKSIRLAALRQARAEKRLSRPME